ncbi:MAG: hypothetical protein RIA63_04035 [Cyclobacteriaceae bacterium]
MNKINTSDDSYISLLKMAREDLKNGEGIDLRKFSLRCKEFKLEGFALDLYRDIYNPEFPQTAGLRTNNFISLDAYLKLLQYDELNHSLKESRQARKEAKLAVYIAVVAVVVQIVLWCFDKII